MVSNGSASQRSRKRLHSGRDNYDSDEEGGAVREVPPSRGLLFRESSARPVLCKPKLLPLQSISLEKLERLQAQQKPPPKNC